MCGIAGIINGTSLSPSSAVELVKRLNDSQFLRGPDGQGIWQDTGVVLGHRRLAIQDLNERAAQPMASRCGRFILVFNGEIYNFHELRQDLIRSGVEFRTQSDTEVLLELFVLRREKCFGLLRGMFALAIWDTKLRKIILARDAYGIKPLYYSFSRSSLCFASQAKAIATSGFQQMSSTEAAGIVGFYLTGSVPEPWTTFKDVFSVPAGHYMIASSQGIERTYHWFNFENQWHRDAQLLSHAEIRELVSASVRDSVQSHLVSDVPISVFLSAGVDSSVVAGVAAETGHRIEGITIGFSEFDGDSRNEIPGASDIAKSLGIKHHKRIFTYEEFSKNIESIIGSMDQPSIDGLNTWFASRAAKELGFKVALSGIGGDELFCGYPSFRQIPRLASMGSVLSKYKASSLVVSPILTLLSYARSQPKLRSITRYWGSVGHLYFLRRALFLPEELFTILPVEFANDGLQALKDSFLQSGSRSFSDPLHEIGFLESTRYLRNQLLRDSDWASMANSVELRTPLVDLKLLEKVAPLTSEFAGGAGKMYLASAARQLEQSEILSRSKTGFATPMNTWLERGGFSKRYPGRHHVKSGRETWARGWATYVGHRFQ